jgi:low affinity Fe/Cu permease
MKGLFRKISFKVSQITGSPPAFLVAVSIVLIWILSGPVFDYSDTWQLAINTFTTVMTFLMVFLIQNTQNRDTKAIHLKLDELIKSDLGARDSLMDIEELSDEEIEKYRLEFKKLHDTYESVLLKRKKVK